MQIDARHLTVCSDGALVTEASDIGIRHTLPYEVTISGDAGPKTFNYFDVDREGEDVAGYRYHAHDGQVLLIIND